MLTAAAYGKLKRRLDLHEDEVTSCIFGAMQHLPVRIIWEIFLQLAQDAKLKKDLFSAMTPDQVKFNFWPKWATGSGHVEPDLVVHFFKDNQPVLHAIVEVKWGAQLSPPCELVRQWRHHLPDDKATWIHLYLVEDSAKGWNEINDSFDYFGEECHGCVSCENKNSKKGLSNGRKFDVLTWKASLGCVGWRHVVVAAKDATKEISHIDRTWDFGMSAFFAKQGIVPFVGFEWIKEKEFEIGEVSAEEMLFFHKKPWFAFLNAEVFDEVEKFFPVDNGIELKGVS